MKEYDHVQMVLFLDIFPRSFPASEISKRADVKAFHDYMLDQNYEQSEQFETS